MESEARCNCCFLRPAPREAQLERRTTRISHDSKRCRRMELVFERLQRRQPQDELLPNLNYSGYLLPSRRELAGGCGAMPRTPLWSFGGQGRKPAKVAVHTKNADDGNQPSVRRCVKSGRVNQSWSELAPLVHAHCEHCNNLLPSVLLRGHASPTPPRLLDRSLQRKHRFASKTRFFF